MDYRKYLGREETLVLPYFGGPYVFARDRRLRVEPGVVAERWYTFTVRGRNVAVKAEAATPSLEDLPPVRGHLHGGGLVRDGAIAEPVHFMPDEEPPRFSPVRARRWHSGELIFDAVDFESEAEELVRRAFEDRGSLRDVKGVPSTLRAAFAYAVVETTARRIGIPATPAEVRRHTSTIAEGGAEAAEAVLRALQAERELARREMEELLRRRAAELARMQLDLAREARLEAMRRLPERARVEDAATRAERALEAAGAQLRSTRVLGEGKLEVIFSFMNERFISIVDAATLQVVDSGICLGHPPRDDLVTLESLPSVIKEAIDTEALVILRHA